MDPTDELSHGVDGAQKCTALDVSKSLSCFSSPRAPQMANDCTTVGPHSTADDNLSPSLPHPEKEMATSPRVIKQVQRIPLLRTRAGPRDKAQWTVRLKEEYTALIQYVSMNKKSDADWFQIACPDEDGIHWKGTCWHYYNYLRYEFILEFDIPVTYPVANPEFRLPELQGKTAKMYHGGKICLTEHFIPLWSRNVPKFGIAHALSLGLAPWLAAEVPDLVGKGLISPQS